jgi:hypothetical protein
MVADGFVNKDQHNPHKVCIVFNDSLTDDHFLTGPADLISFGSAQYQWHPKEREGYPDPAGPAVRSTATARADTALELPTASVTVVRGRVGEHRTPEKRR